MTIETKSLVDQLTADSHALPAGMQPEQLAERINDVRGQLFDLQTMLTRLCDDVDADEASTVRVGTGLIDLVCIRLERIGDAVRELPSAVRS